MRITSVVMLLTLFSWVSLGDDVSLRLADGVQRLDAKHLIRPETTWISWWSEISMTTFDRFAPISYVIVKAGSGTIESIVLIEKVDKEAKPYGVKRSNTTEQAKRYEIVYLRQINEEIVAKKTQLVEASRVITLLKKSWGLVEAAKHSTQEVNMAISKNEEWLLICSGSDTELQVGYGLNPPKDGFLYESWKHLSDFLDKDESGEKEE